MGNKDWSASRKPKIKDLTALILAGGQGTRLRSVLPDTPKAMAPVAGSPFLNHLLEKLATAGLGRTIICTGHLAGQIQEAIGERFQDMEIVYSREEMPMGTGGALRLALPLVNASRALVLNGDSYCDFDVSAFLDWHVGKCAQGSLVLADMDDCARYGSVTLGPEGSVLSFLEKGSHRGPGWINAGAYLLERPLLEGIPEGREVSLERQTFPGLIGKGLFGFRMEGGGFIDIGTPDSYAQASEFFQQRRRGSISDNLRETVKKHLAESARVKIETASECGDAIVSAAALIAKTFREGGKLLLCGNGGSAADCQHMAAEFMSRLTKEFDRAALPAIALTTDTSFLTAYANDCGYDGLFARQVEGLGRPGDVLIGISTSGNSANVLKAFEMCAIKGVSTIALCGAGGVLGSRADVAVSVPSRDTQYIQECHLSIEHMICQLVEIELFAGTEVRQGAG